MIREFGCWLNIIDYPKARLPEKAHVYDAGFDLFLAFEKETDQSGYYGLTIGPGDRCICHTGVHLKLMPGWEAQIRPRSGNAAKKGLTVLNTPGTIDADYTGEIMVILYNSSQDPVTLEEGDKIAQMVLKEVPITALVQLENKPTNEIRGDAGLGSTGQ